MNFWARRRARWAIRVLDAIWCGEEVPSALGLSAADLRVALSHAGVRRRYAELVAADEVTTGATGLSATDAALLGLDAAECTAAPQDGFEARVALHLGPEVGARAPGRTWQFGFAAAAVAAAALLLVVYLPQQPSPTLSDAPGASKHAPAAEEFAVRGAESPADAGLSIVLSGVCLLPGPEGTPVVVNVEDSESEGMACPVNGSFQPVVSDPLARGLSVAVFAVQRSNSGQWSAVPHAPTPASVEPVRLEATATPQPVGRPHRLGVNHAAETTGWLVVIARKDPIGYPELEETMKIWSQGTFPAQSKGDPWDGVAFRPFRVKGER